MAAKKKKGRRQGMFSKLSNAALTLLAMAGPIKIWLFETGDVARKVDRTLQAFTGFAMDGSFKIQRLATGWGPVGASLGVGMALKYVRKKFPVR